PVGDVLEAHLRHERDDDRVPVVLCRLDARIGRFDGSAVAAEDVHLPVGVEACLEEIEYFSRPSRAQPVLARSRTGVGAHRADLRPEIGRRDTARRGGLAAPGAMLAGFAISTRLPSAMFADSPVASTSVVSSPDSTSASFP